ncbi:MULTISPECIES: Pycsar system effector family protein [Nocardiopsis]|uniref:Pycsar system effector family protein n=1 Tax=Nocardiopsis TaxID=2013 RepID=UPI002DBC6960|nr:Pycsar system effector family protein [Nocardiopsis sp. LDBS1602]MEC3895870.1 Pycsar system effector family protein [Nocardiopsis sp. LDBS1602]
MTSTGEASKAAERVQDHVSALLADSREELVRADQKAAILLAAGGVLVGALLASLLPGEAPPEELGALTRALWWVGTAITLLGVACFGCAVFPRVHNTGGRSEVVGYYGDVASYRDDATLRRALEASAAREPDRLVSQLREVARIVVYKYRLLRAGIVLFGVAVLCHAVVLVALRF